MAAPRAIGQTDIVNKAQVLLGQAKRFSELLDTDQKALDYQTLWPTALRSALALHPWNFAIRRKRLVPDTIKPEFGWAERYRLPAECIRFLPWSKDADEHFDCEIEGGYILADRGDFILIRFIGLIEDLSLWSPLFADVMAYTLAMEGCEGSTGKRGLQDYLTSGRENLLVAARRADALENGNRHATRPMTVSSWARARYLRTGWRG